MERILFICTGNTCRSPMAEIILKTKLKLAGIKAVKVSSAGLRAEVGGKISKNSKEALKLLGYKVNAFHPKQATEELLNKQDLIICMTENHKNALKDFNKVFTVAEITNGVEVLDPYGQDLSVYIKTSHLLEDACNIILEQIVKAKGEIK